MAPLGTMLLGVTVLHEHATRLHKLALALAALAVVVLTISYGRPPIVAADHRRLLEPLRPAQAPGPADRHREPGRRDVPAHRPGRRRSSPSWPARADSIPAHRRPAADWVLVLAHRRRHRRAAAAVRRRRPARAVHAARRAAVPRADDQPACSAGSSTTSRCPPTASSASPSCGRPWRPSPSTRCAGRRPVRRRPSCPVSPRPAAVSLPAHAPPSRGPRAVAARRRARRARLAACGGDPTTGDFQERGRGVHRGRRRRRWRRAAG